MSTTIGSNQPRPMTPEQVAEYLQDICAPLITRRDEIMAGVARFNELYPTEIPNAEVQGKAGDFAGAKGAMANLAKAVEAERVKQKQPFDAAATAVQAFMKGLIDPVTKAQAAIRVKMDAFSDRIERESREAARIEAERAAALAAEAERLAQASMTSEGFEQATDLAVQAERAEAAVHTVSAEHTRVSGTYTTVSRHTRWAFIQEESDLMALVKAVAKGEAPLRYLDFHSVRIGQDVRSGDLRKLPGCVIKEVKSTR